MKALLARVKDVASAFEDFKITHIYRSSHPNNVRADALANAALDALKKKAL
jgi:hypothetical protein